MNIVWLMVIFAYKIFGRLNVMVLCLATKQTLLSIVLVNHVMLRPISD